MRLVLFLGVAVVAPLLVTVSPAHAASYTIDKWETDYYRVPCKAWAKNKDGSWSQTGTIYLAGGGEISGRTFTSGREWSMITHRCKNGVPPASGGGEHGEH